MLYMIYDIIIIIMFVLTKYYNHGSAQDQKQAYNNIDLCPTHSALGAHTSNTRESLATWLFFMGTSCKISQASHWSIFAGCIVDSPGLQALQLPKFLMDILPIVHCWCLCSIAALAHTRNWHFLLVVSARSRALRSLADIYAPQNSQSWFTFTPAHISYHNHITFSKNINQDKFVPGPQGKNYFTTACLHWEANIFPLGNVTHNTAKHNKTKTKQKIYLFL